MIALTGGNLVLPDRIVKSATLTIEEGRIRAIHATGTPGSDVSRVDVSDLLVLPGLIDVHVHGVDGYDTLDGPGSVAAIAARQPRYGVTAFCPTTTACEPSALRLFLEQVNQSRVNRKPGSARVLPAHLESNFINPEYAGAQPTACLRLPDDTVGTGFLARDILSAVEERRADVGIVTLAPELSGGLELVAALTRAGHRVSIGHSGADFEEAIAAMDAGVRHATHLFNRMTPMTHRAPGVVGAVLSRDDVFAELICDGFHVHPAVCRSAIAIKGCRRIMGITDGTAGSGLPPGATARLGGRSIHVSETAAHLPDGTLAGSTLTMDRAFRNTVQLFGASVVDAALMCATTPARALGLTGLGAIEEGAVADLTVLDEQFSVVLTYVAGECAYRRGVNADVERHAPS